VGHGGAGFGLVETHTQAGLGEARWGVAWQGEVHTQRTQNTKAGKRGQGEVRYGTVSRGEVWFGVVRRGSAWFILTLMARVGKVGSGVARLGSARHGMARFILMDRRGAAW